MQPRFWYDSSTHEFWVELDGTTHGTEKVSLTKHLMTTKDTDDIMSPRGLQVLGEDTVCKGYKWRTWIPTKADNPSKLELHYWDGRQWVPTHCVRFVPSLDWGADESELK